MGVSGDLSHAEILAPRREEGGTHTVVNRLKQVQIGQQFDRCSSGSGPEFTYS